MLYCYLYIAFISLSLLFSLSIYLFSISYTPSLKHNHKNSLHKHLTYIHTCTNIYQTYTHTNLNFPCTSLPPPCTLTWTHLFSCSSSTPPLPGTPEYRRPSLTLPQVAPLGERSIIYHLGALNRIPSMLERR